MASCDSPLTFRWLPCDRPTTRHLWSSPGQKAKVYNLSQQRFWGGRYRDSLAEGVALEFALAVRIWWSDARRSFVLSRANYDPTTRLNTCASTTLYSAPEIHATRFEVCAKTSFKGRTNKKIGRGARSLPVPPTVLAADVGEAIFISGALTINL